MKTINNPVTKVTYFVGFILLVSLFSISIPLGSAHALSCINPTEMVDDYVTDERFVIARVVVGEVENEGVEHEQQVAVEENLKGEMNSSVLFIYDETWQYLCAGQPAAVGTEAVYVTSDGVITQVVNLDTPLYDSLMSALADVPNESVPATVEETKRSIMQQIIELLQRVISLLQGESALPGVTTEPVAAPDTLIGMTAIEAKSYAEAHDIVFRIVEIDGVTQPTTKDYRPGRINASVENDLVVSYTVEGAEANERVHDVLIGMTQVDAEAYAETNDVLFRVGRIDGEDRPVTMDYRPGRITAEIEDGVVVDYSVE